MVKKFQDMITCLDNLLLLVCVSFTIIGQYTNVTFSRLDGQTDTANGIGHAHSIARQK